MPQDATKGEDKVIPAGQWERILAAVRRRDNELLRSLIRSDPKLWSAIRLKLISTKEYREWMVEDAAKAFQKQLPMLQQRCTPEQVAGIKYYSETGDILGAARKCDVHPLKFLAWLDSIDFSKYLPENE